MDCIFYTLVNGKLPFAALTREEIVKKILKCENNGFDANTPKPWQKLIKAMLRKNPSRRWNLVKITEHLFKYRSSMSGCVSSDSEERIQNEEKKEIINVKKEQSCGRIVVKKQTLPPRVE